MKNDQFNNLISSTLKTVACDNIVSEYELTQASDRSLQDILNEEKTPQNQIGQTDQTENLKKDAQ